MVGYPTKAPRDRRNDFELLVLEALADLVASPMPRDPVALDDCAQKITALVELSSDQRRGLCGRLAQVRILARGPPRQSEAQ
jgi:hypothetical protein